MSHHGAWSFTRFACMQKKRPRLADDEARLTHQRRAYSNRCRPAKHNKRLHQLARDHCPGLVMKKGRLGDLSNGSNGSCPRGPMTGSKVLCPKSKRPTEPVPDLCPGTGQRHGETRPAAGMVTSTAVWILRDFSSRSDWTMDDCVRLASPAFAEP